MREFFKLISFRYLKLGKPRYNYNIEPIQLAFLINEIERLKDTNGCICEIGVARGQTTRFIAEHIQTQNISKNNKYYAIDTFDSFLKSDLDFEVKNLGKKYDELKGFGYNSFNIWKKNFSNFDFIEAIKTDCSTFDYSNIGPIKMTFLDVDLYLPTKNALNKVFEETVIGGVIIVDDVREDATYNGAFKGYMEFCKDNKFNPIFIGNKCGVIYKK